MIEPPAPRPRSHVEELRQLLAPILHAHGMEEGAAAPTLEALAAAPAIASGILQRCCAAPPSEADVLACLLAAVTAAKGRMDGDRLHGALSLMETVATLMSFADDRPRTPREP